MTDSNSASPNILKLMYNLFQTNTSHFNPFLGPNIGPEMGQTRKIVADLGLVSQNIPIEIDIQLVPNEHMIERT